MEILNKIRVVGILEIPVSLKNVKIFDYFLKEGVSFYKFHCFVCISYIFFAEIYVCM